MTTTDGKITYQITLVPAADCRQDEAERGLKWILKRAKRQFGLRCVKVERVGGDDQPPSN